MARHSQTWKQAKRQKVAKGAKAHPDERKKKSSGSRLKVKSGPEVSPCTPSPTSIAPGHRAIVENSLNYRQSDAIISTFSDVTNIPCSTLRRQLKGHSFPIIKCNPTLLAQILDILAAHPKMARVEMVLEQWMHQGSPGSDMIDLIGAELAYAKIMSKGSDFKTPLDMQDVPGEFSALVQRLQTTLDNL